MYDQKYIDERPTYEVAQVAKLKTKQRLAIKHFKSKLGCVVCACTMKSVSAATKKIECANCLKQFKGLQLPFREVCQATVTKRGLNPIKLSAETCGGINARQAKAWRYTVYMQRHVARSSVLPVVFGGMNTK
jgi:protein-arginine kinase activator protein McsA